MPNINKRSQYNLAKLDTEDFVPFDSFFDHDYFVKTMSRDCPQMTIHQSMDELWDIPSLAQGIDVDPHYLLENHDFNVMITEPEKWREAFDEWLSEHLKEPQYALMDHRLSAKLPVRVNINGHKTLFSFPIQYDPPEFVENYGRLMHFRPNIHRLAATVLYNLNNRFNLSIDPSQGVTKEKYMGAHVRTDADVAQIGWRGYNFQQDHYIQQCLLENIQVMYVASGDPEATQKLRSLARAKYGIYVVTKYDLLSGPELEEVKSLSWDQQGLIDFEVLLKSSTFGGIEQSTFAWNVALRRQLVSQFSLAEALSSPDPVLPWTLVDELSTIYGDVGAWRWFTQTMWP